jgi:hypothetical protein
LPPDIEARDPRRAGTRRQKRREHLDDGALASTIGPDQPEYLARRNCEVDIIHGSVGAEPARQSNELEGGLVSLAMCRIRR